MSEKNIDYSPLPANVMTAIILTALFMILSNYVYDIIIYFFWKIIDLIKYITVKVIWGNIVKFWHLIYKHIIHPSWEGIKTVFWDVIHFIENLWGGVKKYGGIVWRWIKKMFGKGVHYSEEAYNSGIKPAAEFVYHIGKDIVIWGVSKIKAIWNFIKPLVEGYIDLFKIIYIDIIFDSIKDIAESIYSIFNRLIN